MMVIKFEINFFNSSSISLIFSKLKKFLSNIKYEGLFFQIKPLSSLF
jgi:hypothetical protein